jgi:hypothetical protein
VADPFRQADGPTEVIDADIASVGGAVTEADLPGILQRMRRLAGRRGRRQAEIIWAAAYILLGLRYSSELSAQLFRGVVSMKESSTYQAIVEEGRVEGIARGAIAELKKMLRVIGEQAFGAPDAATLTAIEKLNNLERLEDLVKGVRIANGWADLSGRPASARKSTRRPTV